CGGLESDLGAEGDDVDLLTNIGAGGVQAVDRDPLIVEEEANAAVRLPVEAQGGDLLLAATHAAAGGDAAGHAIVVVQVENAVTRRKLPGAETAVCAAAERMVRLAAAEAAVGRAPHAPLAGERI